MANGKNRFFSQRTVKASFTLVNSSVAVTHVTGVYIPAGAIITGVRMVAPGAITITGASGTVQLRAGAVNIIATTNVSALGAQTVPTVKALATTAGNYLTVDSELNMVIGASNNSAATATYDVYVDYIYA